VSDEVKVTNIKKTPRQRE